MDIVGMIERNLGRVLPRELLARWRVGASPEAPLLCPYGHEVFSGNKVCNYGHHAV